MNLYLDCIPCLIRQTIDASTSVTDDPAVHEKMLKEVLLWCSKVDFSTSAPVMASQIHRRLREITGIEDPYAEIKAEHNRLAMQLLSELEHDLETAEDPLQLSVRLAIAGNIIDLGAKGTVEKEDIHDSINRALQREVDGDFELFRSELEKADKILYLADNAGEIVFDRLLIERLPMEKVILAVRGKPVINDVTVKDAEQCGLTDIVKVIDNGSDAPGTVLSECSDEFRRIFDEADVIISKGQGNYETLSDVDANIFFLFKVKCKLVAEQSGMEIGSQVLMRTGGQPA